MPNPVARVLVRCLTCDAPIWALPKHVALGRNRFCSRACLGASKRHGSFLNCTLCLTRFYRRFGEQDHAIQFCSRECRSTWRADNRMVTTYPKRGSKHVHRLVAEICLGRKLLPGEVVHHIDENRHNNHPSNLAVFPDQATHMRCHAGKMSDAELRTFLIV